LEIAVLMGYLSKKGDRTLRNLRENWRHYLVRILTVIIFLLVWHLLIIGARNGVQVLQNYHFHELPTPYETAEAFYRASFPEDKPPIRQVSMFVHAEARLQRVLEGFFLGCLVGVPTGLLMGRFRYFEDSASTLIELIRPIPPIAWVYIIYVVLVNDTPVFIVFIGSVFPVILSTMNGVKGIDPVLIEAAETLGAGKKEILYKVVFPATLPSIVTGMKIGLGIGWMTVVAAEMVGLSEPRGLGYFLWSNSIIPRYDYIAAGMIMIGIIGYIMSFVLERIENGITDWQLKS